MEKIPNMKFSTPWILWVHKVDDEKWDKSSYIKIARIKTIKDFWNIYNNWDELMPPLDYGIFFLMRDKIFPKWEDKSNIAGGCWSLRIVKTEIRNVWDELSMAIMGEYLANDSKENNNLNGLSISPKRSFCVIKIWTKRIVEDEENYFSPYIPFLDLKGSIYRKHIESLEADKEKIKQEKIKQKLQEELMK